MHKTRIVLTIILLAAVALALIGSTEASDSRVVVIDVDHPGLAGEGEEITIGCILSNPGNAPALGLSVRFSVGDEVVGVVILDEPLIQRSELTVITPWTAQLGRHLVLVEVFRNDVLLCSDISDGTILVEPVPLLEDDPLPDPDEEPKETHMPEMTAEVEDGTDMTTSLPIIVTIAFVVAVSYMIWVLVRPGRWDD